MEDWDIPNPFEVKDELFECNACVDKIHYDSNQNKWFLRIEGNSWDYYNDCFEYQDIECNYCYQCGKNLNT